MNLCPAVTDVWGLLFPTLETWSWRRPAGGEGGVTAETGLGLSEVARVIGPSSKHRPSVPHRKGGSRCLEAENLYNTGPSIGRPFLSLAAPSHCIPLPEVVSGELEQHAQGAKGRVAQAWALGFTFVVDSFSPGLQSVACKASLSPHPGPPTPAPGCKTVTWGREENIRILTSD